MDPTDRNYLTPNFTMAEFVKSQTAFRRGIDNSLPGDLRIAVLALCTNVLEPVRDKFGVTVITSGYRSPELNLAIGGSQNSQHMFGEAADIECPGTSNLELAWFINDELVFDQLILEYYVHGQPYSGWVHVSYSRTNNRRMVMTKPVRRPLVLGLPPREKGDGEHS